MWIKTQEGGLLNAQNITYFRVAKERRKYKTIAEVPGVDWVVATYDNEQDAQACLMRILAGLYEKRHMIIAEKNPNA